jgi:DnaJ-class molecular chaperone
MKRSFYETLGVPHHADGCDRQCYAQTVAKLNEATNMRGTIESVAEMNPCSLSEGHQLLSNPAQRVKYDAKLSAAAAGIQPSSFRR